MKVKVISEKWTKMAAMPIYGKNTTYMVFHKHKSLVQRLSVNYLANQGRASIGRRNESLTKMATTSSIYGKSPSKIFRTKRPMVLKAGMKHLGPWSLHRLLKL